MLLSQTYTAEWSTKSKLLFRFLFSYLMLYIILMFSSSIFETPFKWIGNTILNFNYEFDVNGYGSGDNTYAYITLFINFVLAIIITAVWSVVHKNRKSYNIAFYWFVVVLRIFLILSMLLYGFVKVFQIQFQPPSFIKLLQPLGEFSPMGLAWTYMGYSKGFGIFAGILEILGGIFLVWRRTSTFGAFVIIGVMTQVAMMNLMFDIPVKLFSIHLILMAGVIFMTDIHRFLAIFFKNKDVKAYDFYYPKLSNNYHKTISIIKKIALPILLILGMILGYLGELNISNVNHKPHLYGIWETKTFIKNKDTIPPLITDAHRWHYLIIQNKKKAVVKTMTNKLSKYTFITDTIKNNVSMYKTDGIKDSLNLQFDFKENTLELKGILESDSIHIYFTKKNMNDFPLMSRGFNWINETPYNQ